MAGDEPKRVLTAKDLTFRCSDHQPYFSQRKASTAYPVEPVYLSPHFDLSLQCIVDPRHMEELVAEVEFNSRIGEFEKLFLSKRIRA